MGTMGIVLIALAGAAWPFGAGYTARLLDRLDWDVEMAWTAAILLWPVFLLGTWGFMAQGRMAKLLAERRARRGLPGIRIAERARIGDWDQYRRIVALCAEFEAENGIDDHHLLGGGP